MTLHAPGLWEWPSDVQGCTSAARGRMPKAARPRFRLIAAELPLPSTHPESKVVRPLTAGIGAGSRTGGRVHFFVRTKKWTKENRSGRVVATRLPSRLATLRGPAERRSLASRPERGHPVRVPSGQPCSQRRIGTLQRVPRTYPSLAGSSSATHHTSRFSIPLFPARPIKQAG